MKGLGMLQRQNPVSMATYGADVVSQKRATMERDCIRTTVRTLFQVRQLAKERLNKDQQQAIDHFLRKLLEHRPQLQRDFWDEFFIEEFPGYLSNREQAQSLEFTATEQHCREAMHFFALVRICSFVEEDAMNHIERTAALSRYLATELQCDSAFIRDIYYGAKLHDVGLIGVPKDILRKRGTLDIYEHQVIDEHTRIGAYIINTAINSLGLESGPFIVGKEIAYHHHDRYDGTGIHSNKGTEIPYSARIFAIADAYDNIRRERPHRPATTHQQAVKLLCGSNAEGFQQFDPGVLTILMATQRDIEELYSSMNLSS
jgi:response regulator RpfG family c-di-GMP phosphodiesterase